MPSMVNGIGTRYVGRSNVAKTAGTCSSCKRQTTLTSYDTTLCFCVVFIPLVPLGRKRIIDQCPACTRHRVLPLEAYQQARQRNEQMLAAYRASPADPELAVEAIKACAGYRDLPSFLALAPTVEANLPGDVRTANLLAAGYEMFGRPADAERVLRAGLAAADDDDTSEHLANLLIRRGALDEAAQYLQHIVDDGIPDKVGPIFGLAQAYQRRGDHENALAWFDRCQAINPNVAQDKVFAKYRDASVARRGTTKAYGGGRSFNRARAAKVWGGIAAAGFVGYLLVAWLWGVFHTVYLVDGVDKPYDVRIDGRKYMLVPGQPTQVRLSEGRHKLQIVDPALPVPDETIDVRTDFWGRPFAGHAIVVNPDRAAVVVRRVVEYHARQPTDMGNNDTVPVQELHAGQQLYVFDGVDYPFTDPPQSITTDQHATHSTTKVTVFAVPATGVEAAVGLVGSTDEIYDRGAAVAAAVAGHLRFDPAGPAALVYLGWASEKLTPAEFADLLRPGLSARPLLLDWHRAYQQAAEVAGRIDAVRVEYDRKLAADPTDVDLAYLDSRVQTDPDKALDLLRRATAGPTPSAYAVGSLGATAIEAGDFAAAVDPLTRAAAMTAASAAGSSFATLRDQALMYAGRTAEAIRLAEPAETDPLVAMVAYRTGIAAAALGHDRPAADAVCRRFQTRLGPKAQSDPSLAELQATADYAFGDPGPLARVALQQPGGSDRFVGHLLDGDPDAAARDLGSHATAVEYLELYLAAADRNPSVAGTALTSAVAALNKGDYDDRQYAAALSGTDAVPIDTLLRVREAVEEKRLLLTALGRRRPEVREACFALARKIDVDPLFPHLLVRRVLDGT